MIKVVPLKVAHVEFLKTVGALTYLTDYIEPEALKALENSKYAFTGLNEAGVPLGCAGLVQYWDGRAEAWAFFNPNCRKYFLEIHKAVSKFLNSCSTRRIEATVDINFVAGHRWVKLLGFEMEGPRLRRYTIDGRDVVLYSRIQGD